MGPLWAPQPSRDRDGANRGHRRYRSTETRKVVLFVVLLLAAVLGVGLFGDRSGGQPGHGSPRSGMQTVGAVGAVGRASLADSRPRHLPVHYSGTSCDPVLDASVVDAVQSQGQFAVTNETSSSAGTVRKAPGGPGRARASRIGRPPRTHERRTHVRRHADGTVESERDGCRQVNESSRTRTQAEQRRQAPRTRGCPLRQAHRALRATGRGRRLRPREEACLRVSGRRAGHAK